MSTSKAGQYGKGRQRKLKGTKMGENVMRTGKLRVTAVSPFPNPKEKRGIWKKGHLEYPLAFATSSLSDKGNNPEI